MMDDLGNRGVYKYCHVLQLECVIPQFDLCIFIFDCICSIGLSSQWYGGSSSQRLQFLASTLDTFSRFHKFGTALVFTDFFTRFGNKYNPTSCTVYSTALPNALSGDSDDLAACTMLTYIHADNEQLLCTCYLIAAWHLLAVTRTAPVQTANLYLR